MHLLTKEGDDTEASAYTLFSVTSSKAKPLVTTFRINNADRSMEMYMGASVSIISEAMYNELWPKENALAMQDSMVRLWTYTGEELRVLGTINVDVCFKGQEEHQSKEFDTIRAAPIMPALK